MQLHTWEGPGRPGGHGRAPCQCSCSGAWERPPVFLGSIQCAETCFPSPAPGRGMEECVARAAPPVHTRFQGQSCPLAFRFPAVKHPACLAHPRNERQTKGRCVPPCRVQVLALPWNLSRHPASLLAGLGHWGSEEVAPGRPGCVLAPGPAQGRAAWCSWQHKRPGEPAGSLAHLYRCRRFLGRRPRGQASASAGTGSTSYFCAPHPRCRADPFLPGAASPGHWRVCEEDWSLPWFQLSSEGDTLWGPASPLLSVCDTGSEKLRSMSQPLGTSVVHNFRLCHLGHLDFARQSCRHSMDTGESLISC